jgi:hypothetical protein
MTLIEYQNSEDHGEDRDVPPIDAVNLLQPTGLG